MGHVVLGAHESGQIPQIRERGRRDHGQVPSSRRLFHLRHPGPHGPGLLPALPAGAGPRQLRFHRRRFARGHALYRGAPRAHLGRDACGHREGDRGLAAELRCDEGRAQGPAREAPQPAFEWKSGHRGRHGDQHAAPQPARSGGRHPASRGEARREPRRHHGSHPGPGLPDRRHHFRRQGHPGGVRDRQGRGHDPGQGGDRGAQEPPVRHSGDRDTLPGEQIRTGEAHRGARAGQEDRRHPGRARRVRPRGPAACDRAQERRAAPENIEPALPAHGPAEGFPHEHDRAHGRDHSPASVRKGDTSRAP